MAIPNAVGIASPLIGGWLIEVLGINRAIKFLFLVGAIISMIIAYVRHRFLVETAENPDPL
jgi:MFS family permease